MGLSCQDYFNGRRRSVSQRIFSKHYFWYALGIPLILAGITAAIILHSTNLDFYLTKDGIDNFYDIFKIPLNLLGTVFVSTGFAVAYYRVTLSYDQNQIQLEQSTQTNYTSFRSEFMSMLNEKEYKYAIINISNSWLFCNLYPTAKLGDNKLHSEFEKFVNDESQRFISAMTNLLKTLSSSNGTRYHAGSYLPVSGLFMWLRDIIALDADVNLSFVSDASFTDSYSEQTIGVARDILHIVGTVNAFEGWRFFSNKDYRSWRKAIDQLEVTRQEAVMLTNYFAQDPQRIWRSALFRDDLETFKKIDVLNDFPSELRNNAAAKWYVFEVYNSSQFAGILTSEARDALASALHLVNR